MFPKAVIAFFAKIIIFQIEAIFFNNLVYLSVVSKLITLNQFY